MIEKAKEKLKKLDLKIKQLLDKPIVKTLILFVECALPSIVELALVGFSGIAAMMSGYKIVELIKQTPKFIKALIDAFKSLRTGYKDKNPQTKYINYGKGTAALVMVIILGTLGINLKSGSKK